jgi:TolB protein
VSRRRPDQLQGDGRWTTAAKFATLWNTVVRVHCCRDRLHLLTVAAICAGLLAGVEGAAGRTAPSGTIAFVRFSIRIGHPRIFTIEVGDSRAHRLPLPVPAAEGPAWSRDGRRLVFIGGTNRAGERDISGNDALYVSSADGSHTRRVTSGRWREAGPAWSPDSRRIVFTRAAVRGSGSSLWTVAASGGRARRLTYGNVDLEPSWSPDGRWIAFLRVDARTYQSALWTVRPDGSGLHRILPGLKNGSEPVWSPRGDRLLLEDGRSLFTVRPDGGHRMIVTDLAADAQGNLEDPQASWSPDGKWVAFAQFRSGAVGGSDIWLVGADGLGSRRLVRAPEVDSDPTWRP